MIEHELRTTQRTTEIVHITNDETGEARSYTLTNEPTSAVVYTDQLHEATAARIVERLQQEIVPIPASSRMTALKISGFFGVIFAASPPIDTLVRGNERLISLKESLVYGGVLGQLQ